MWIRGGFILRGLNRTSISRDGRLPLPRVSWAVLPEPPVILFLLFVLVPFYLLSELAFVPHFFLFLCFMNAERSVVGTFSILSWRTGFWMSETVLRAVFFFYRRSVFLSPGENKKEKEVKY